MIFIIPNLNSYKFLAFHASTSTARSRNRVWNCHMGCDSLPRDELTIFQSIPPCPSPHGTMISPIKQLSKIMLTNSVKYIHLGIWRWYESSTSSSPAHEPSIKSGAAGLPYPVHAWRLLAEIASQWLLQLPTSTYSRQAKSRQTSASGAPFVNKSRPIYRFKYLKELRGSTRAGQQSSKVDPRGNNRQSRQTFACCIQHPWL